MKKIFLCILIILSIFLFYGCKSWDEKYIIPYSVNQLVINYFGGFKAGSWWVYVDSTGNIDSANIGTYSRSGGTTVTVHHDGSFISHPYYPIDNISFTIISKNYGTLTFNITGGEYSNNIRCARTYGPSDLEIFQLAMNGQSGDTVKFSSSPPVKVQTIDSFDQFYKNAIEISSPPLIDSFPMYFAENYGIVQKTIHGHTFYLKKYNIVN